MSEREDRYQPIPGLTALPAWLWRRMGRRMRAALALVVLVILVGMIPLAATIRDTKRESAAGERRDQARLRAETIQRLRKEQRPRTGRSVPGASRVRLQADLSAGILVDARRRARAGEFPSRARRVECKPFDATRWSCTAVTVEDRTVYSGVPYRARTDRRSGRFAFCKVSGQAELTRRPLVPTPRECGGS